MRSKDKLEVIAKLMPRYGNKRWVIVKIKPGAPGFEDRSFVPSFEDWHRMIRATVHCEREKYAHLDDPDEMVKRFFMRCIEEPDFEVLREEFKIPKRD